MQILMIGEIMDDTSINVKDVERSNESRMVPKRNTLYVKLSDEERRKLEEIVKSKYRGVSLSQAIRWLIEDTYKQQQLEG